MSVPSYGKKNESNRVEKRWDDCSINHAILACRRSASVNLFYSNGNNLVNCLFRSSALVLTVKIKFLCHI
jgi:hypothetical protein